MLEWRKSVEESLNLVFGIEQEFVVVVVVTGLVTSAKEVMFYPASLCLSFCLSVSNCT